MRASTTELNQNEERLKEYQRQQERLKAMTTNSDKIKSMSADVMIENLLKQNIVKPNSTVESRINSGSGLPIWLDCESTDLPGPYKHYWSLVKSTTSFADTQKVSQLLLTSGLSMEVLGFIWNLSNKAVPGQLNKQEFYIVLALVALAQTGYTFNNLSVLNMVPNAPIPTLQSKVLEKFGRSTNPYVSQVRSYSEESFSLPQPGPVTTNSQSLLNITTTSLSTTAVSEPGKDIPLIKQVRKLSRSSSKDLVESDSSRDFSRASNFPFIGSSPTAELENEDDFSEFQSATLSEPSVEEKKDSVSSSQLDDFTDFQCADITPDPLEAIVLSQKKEIPKIPLPRNLSGKLSSLRSNILKISPESEKKLKVLTQSETLSTLPESKISSSNKVSTMPNISVLGGSRDIGMRLANHSLGSKAEKQKHQRHHKHKQSTHSEDILFPTRFGAMDELFPKCFQKSSKTFVLKETKIDNTDSNEPESSSKSDGDNIPDPFPPGKNTRKIEIPMLGTFNETTLPTQSENNLQPTIELFSVEEDKYSALREVEMEMKLKNNELKQSLCNGSNNLSDEVDDFGEFLSADIPPVPVEDVDLWGEWNNSQCVQPTVPDTVQKYLETVNSLKLEDLPKPVENTNKIDPVNALAFDLLSLNDEDNSRTILPLSDFNVESTTRKTDFPFNSVTEQFEMKPEKTEEKALNDLDDLLMLDNSSTIENSHFLNNSILQTTTELVNQDEDFGMFFTSDFNQHLPYGNREDSLPSLDLKMSETGDQETVRKKCLVACLNLMQQGFDIFNGVSSMSVLEEVCSTQEAVNYLNNLNITYQISRRVVANSGEILSIQEDIERIWRKLVNYCYEYNISLREDLDTNAPVGAQCNVCSGFIGSDTVDQGMNSYHPSCANFWVNCVESDLPCPI